MGLCASGMSRRMSGGPDETFREWDGRGTRLRKDSSSQYWPNRYMASGLTPLHLACEVGDVTVTKLLLKMEADVNLPTSDAHGRTPPLLFAAANGHDACVLTLLEAGADPNASDCWGNTALFKASCYNHVTCVKHLLQYKADPNVTNRWKALPLQYAALQGHAQCVHLLLHSGSDIGLRGEVGMPPPLSGAAMRGHFRCLKYLLEHKAQLDYSVNNNGETALLFGLKYFLHAIAGDLSEVSRASLHDRFMCIRVLVDSGAAITSHCMDLLRHEARLGWERDPELLLTVKLILRAYTYRASDIVILEDLFEQMLRIGRDKWTYMRLICSVGYTPSLTVIDRIHYSLTDDEYQDLDTFRRNPRSLKDICRLNIRSRFRHNAIHAVRRLPLPTPLSDYVNMKIPYHYSL